jgi:hypothetical protein
MTDTTSQQDLMAEVEALSHALEQLPRNDRIERAIYHCERLRVAIGSSHNEGTRFAAFTVSKLLRDLGEQLPPEIPARMQQIRGALEARGLDLHK